MKVADRQFELEYKIVYSIIVAGKSAKFTDTVMDRLNQHIQDGETYFSMIRRQVHQGSIDSLLRLVKCGNYSKIAKALYELACIKSINLETCTPEQLESIHGIGPKTSRFFIIWTRPDAKFAALDVHILRWLRSVGHALAPKSTPSGKKYSFWEGIFLEECRIRNKTPRELDHEVWMAGSKYNGEVQAVA